MVISGASRSGNNSLISANSSITNFSILKFFEVRINPPKPRITKEVLRSPPILDCVKCNTNGASIGNPGDATYGGIFRNANVEFLGAFSINLGVTSALSSELIN